MASAKFQGNRFKIDREIAKNHAILVDHFKFDGEYNKSEIFIEKYYIV